MKRFNTVGRADFAVLHDTGTSQAAMMTIAPGESTQEGAEQNEHAWAEQWLYVVSGQGEARSGKKRIALAVGTLILIEKGEPHVIENTGTVPLVTFNVYAPPAYDRAGDPLY